MLLFCFYHLNEIHYLIIIQYIIINLLVIEFLSKLFLPDKIISSAYLVYIKSLFLAKQSILQSISYITKLLLYAGDDEKPMVVFFYSN